MSESAEPVLLVAVCTGARCLALRRMRADPNDSDDDTCGRQIRTAVRERHDAVMVSTGCLERCDQGSVAVVGSATCRTAGRLEWLAPPRVLGMIDIDRNAAAAVELIKTLPSRPVSARLSGRPPSCH